ncbi:GNAT family N-acetyltransferase [Phytoactinopolyspora halotolerans]|uniref:GNAT family N-acetyltransferase n=1 Tax=Phytoactinopolyspora halotolerans TaxID=1981512 RepID=UPI001C20AB41|nr:GNAT family N-acetyltransferase [Phytoactinopolyspora halotolerans]
MLDVTQSHTADLESGEREAIRRLLNGAFKGDFSAEDWDHTLGGVHVIGWDGHDVVAHVAVVQRRLVHREMPIRTGYVEGLAVRKDRRRRGYAAAMMKAAEQITASAYDLGALSDGTGIDGFYQRRGWLTWQGPTWALTPDGIRRTRDDDGGVMVFKTPTSPELGLDEAIVCDWRSGDVW